MSPDPQFPTSIVTVLVIVIVVLIVIRRRNAGKTNTNLGWYPSAMDLNLLLWGATLYHTFPKFSSSQIVSIADFSDPSLAVACIGFLLSLILSHCAYYDFRNPKTRLTIAPPNSHIGEPDGSPNDSQRGFLKKVDHD